MLAKNIRGHYIIKAYDNMRELLFK